MTDTKRSRNFCFTLNNYKPDELKSLEDKDCQYITWGYEVAPSTGTPHLQGHITWKEPKSLASTIKLLPRCHVEMSKDFDASIKYCHKGGDFKEVGKRPMASKAKGNLEAERWAHALAEAKAGGEVSDPQIAFQHARTVDYIHQREVLKKVRGETDERMEWFYGATGTGKSRKARELYPDAYLKMCNKWWDGYNEEDYVLIEDFDKKHECLIHHIKIWADRYPFLTEKKGSSTKIRPKKIIVTSNWHPSQIWSAPEDLGPILRRFKCIEFKALEDNDTT